MTATHSDVPSPEGSMKEQTIVETDAGDVVERCRVEADAAAELARKDAAGTAAQLGTSRSPLVKFGRLVLFVLLVLFGSIMCLGVGVAVLECIDSYDDERQRFGEFLFTAFFEGYLGWGALWLALRVNPWAKPGRKTWRWVRIVLATGGVLLIAATVMAFFGALVWILAPLRQGNTDLPASDLMGTWDLVLDESSRNFGLAEIESGTLEFRAGGQATRTLRFKQDGQLAEHISHLDEWKLVGSDKLRFKLRETQERYELSISRPGDRLSFMDWETYGPQTYRRVPAGPQ